MAQATFIQIPNNLQDPVVLRRFLEKLVLQVDIAFGNRGTEAFAEAAAVAAATISSTDVQNQIDSSLVSYIKKNGTSIITDTLVYDDATTVLVVDDEDIPHKKYVDDNFISSTNNTTKLTYDDATLITIDTDEDIPHKKYVDELHPKQPLINELNQTISTTYSQTEVQDISDKLDEVLAALKSANIVSDV